MNETELKEAIYGIIKRNLGETCTENICDNATNDIIELIETKNKTIGSFDYMVKTSLSKLKNDIEYLQQIDRSFWALKNDSKLKTPIGVAQVIVNDAKSLLDSIKALV